MTVVACTCGHSYEMQWDDTGVCPECERVVFMPSPGRILDANHALERWSSETTGVEDD